MLQSSWKSRARTGFLVFCLSLVLLLGGCALFQPRDCETDELPDLENRDTQIHSFN